MTSTTAAASTTSEASNAVLSVEDLRVHFTTADGVVKAVDGLDYALEGGKTLGIVGESGSGKSVSSAAILGLHNPKFAKITGKIAMRYKSGQLAAAGPTTMRLTGVEQWQPTLLARITLSGLRIGNTDSGTIEEILFGPSRVADGTMNLMGALRRSMATTGYTELKEFQRVEIVVE